MPRNMLLLLSKGSRPSTILTSYTDLIEFGYDVQIFENNIPLQEKNGK
jgi:hypothetical protein